MNCPLDGEAYDIYKTAGTSVTDVLIPHARLIEKISGYYPSRYAYHAVNRVFGLGDKGNSWINGIHKHATASQVKKYLQGNYDNDFKFSFVRHPMDWLVSLYNYIRNTRHRDHGVANELSFKEFALREIHRGSKRQWDFLSDGEKLIVDYVGKYEFIDEDISYLATKLGLPVRKLPHKNKSSGSFDHFTDYYDDELKEAVANYYKVDFIQFGYQLN